MSDAETFMAEVEALSDRAPGLAPLHAALLLAVAEGLAADTRSFASRFGVAHALALRAASDLADGLLTITGRNAKTQRTALALTEAGRALLAKTPEPLAA